MTTSRKTRVLTVALMGTVVALACKNERAITTQPIGDLGFGQAMGKIATNMPRGRTVYPAAIVASGGADSLIISLAGLDSLTSGSYQVWVANDSATKFFKVTGNLVVSRIDTTLNAAGDPVFTPSTRTYAGVSSFTVGGQNQVLRFDAARGGMAGIAATDSMNVVIVSIETSAAATAPGTSRVMWTRRSQAGTSGATLRVAGMRFGNFKPRLAEEYVFATSTANLTSFSAGTTIIPRGRMEVRGSILVVNDSNYYRPPVGYYYAAWAIKTDTLGRFIDTIPLGDKASPYPVRASFYDADVSIPDPLAMYGSPPGAPPVIVAAAHRVSADSIPAALTAGKKPWYGFSWVYVTLQSKSAPKERMGAPVIMSGPVPAPVVGR